MEEKIRALQKNGEYRFEGMSREQTKIAAGELARAATRLDRKNGLRSRYGIVRDSFGYYYTIVING